MRLAGTSQVLSTCWRDSGHTAVCYTGQNVGCAPGDTSVQTGQSHACNILPSSPQGLYIEPAVHKLPILAPFASPAPTPSTGSCYTPPLVLILQGAKSAGNTNKERILANKYICPVYSSLVTTLLSTAAHCLRKA